MRSSCYINLLCTSSTAPGNSVFELGIRIGKFVTLHYKSGGSAGHTNLLQTFLYLFAGCPSIQHSDQYQKVMTVKIDRYFIFIFAFGLISKTLRQE